MMMPANYSVIAENEMTYVNGGALIDCFAPIMNEGNWKTFNTNLIKIVGNDQVPEQHCWRPVRRRLQLQQLGRHPGGQLLR